jgi:hypothetical protein
MNRSTKTAVAIASLVLLFGGLGLAYRAGWLWRSAEEKKVAELKQELTEKIKNQRSFVPRPKMFESLTKQVANLSEQGRKQFQQSAARIVMAEMERGADEYLKMTPAERTKELDKRIDEIEKMREQREAQRKQAGANTSNATGSNAQAPRQPAGQGGPFGGGRGGGIGAILDNTSPKFRAKMSVFLVDLERRRSERGLPPMGPR